MGSSQKPGKGGSGLRLGQREEGAAKDRFHCRNRPVKNQFGFTNPDRPSGGVYFCQKAGVKMTSTV